MLAARFDQAATGVDTLRQPRTPVRAARNWLAWTQAELAQRANVGLSTVKESGKRTPIANNVEAIRRALEAAGIEFTANGLSGPMQT